MKAISKSKFILYYEVGAVEEAVFPLEGAPYVIILGINYRVRGLSRRGLVDQMEK